MATPTKEEKTESRAGNKLVPASKSLGYSSIYLDFLGGEGSAADFFGLQDMGKTAVLIEKHLYPREAMREVLRRQNAQYGVSERTVELLDRLTDPRSVCILTGQQAGLFCGPMYTIIKAIAISKAARLYSQKLDRPVIPVFWIAGDDHDLDEVNNMVLLDRLGEEVLAKYPHGPTSGLPVSRVCFSDEAALTEMIDTFKSQIGQSDYSADLFDRIESAYSSSDSFCTAFGKLMASLLGDNCPVMFNPCDDEAKNLAIDLFSRIVEQQDDLHIALSARNKALHESGYHIQVEKKENSAHLFYADSQRLPVLRDNADFRIGDEAKTASELQDLIRKHPERFSPDVLTRPILQSFLLPTVCQIGGPSEIAYLAQVNPLFEQFSLCAPFYRARPTATVIEARFEKLMSEHSICFESLTGDIEQVVNRVLAESFPSDIEERFQALASDVAQRFSDFADQSLSHYPDLKRNAAQSAGKIDFILKQFESKVFATHKKRSGEMRERIYRLWHSLCPKRTLQERSLNVTYFISRHGLGFIDYLYDSIDSEETDHQLIYLSLMED